MHFPGALLTAFAIEEVLEHEEYRKNDDLRVPSCFAMNSM
jgi:hypothetical protein